ncbi:hypothetical protein TVAG_016610 [Trichomonas vaginalis G3]|uniref:SPIN90/Ldb17 leucine-rich domain-containing protein n=1 Tax=Trichomonas vaginalis (strain ATCC PRA-98 / G3) TaxID=412133 RepID=A2EQZ9_TRIV3|nr:armadillo (ARM) repeat-containing protein family [Trichomonas vaginalis G3]EAY04889.1 hypothetical protein TVAG_016610 [Trichomonas vaginalis G3]KAI5519453.1 armadillo (ARM) repeat-containing protein family [Trichomonas vaginalis G3]|eukprot:XP_001317112.1 hypothetical protein [Trichomonas vaginalis G3]
MTTEDYKTSISDNQTTEISTIFDKNRAYNESGNPITEKDTDILLKYVTDLQSLNDKGQIAQIHSIISDINTALSYNSKVVSSILNIDEFYVELEKSVNVLAGYQEILEAFRLCYNLLICNPGSQEKFIWVFEIAINECINTPIADIYYYCSKIIFSFISNVPDNENNLNVVEIKDASMRSLQFSSREIECGSRIYEFIIKHCNPMPIRRLMFRDLSMFIRSKKLTPVAMSMILSALSMYLINYSDDEADFRRNNIFDDVHRYIFGRKTSDGSPDCGIRCLLDYFILVSTLIKITNGEIAKRYYQCAHLQKFNYFFTEDFDKDCEGIYLYILELHCLAINNMSNNMEFRNFLISSIPLFDIMNFEGSHIVKCMIIQFVSIYVRNFAEEVEPQYFLNFLIDYSEFLDDQDGESDITNRYIVILIIMLEKLRDDEFKDTYIDDLRENGVYDKLGEMQAEASDEIAERISIALSFFNKEEAE